MAGAGKRYAESRPRSNEWYTPAHVIEAARAVMGGIDLDPASCEEANRVVQAQRYYTKADDGLTLPWIGRVWLNPPYSSRGSQAVRHWVMRLVSEYEHANVTEAVLLLNNVADTRHGRQALGACAAVCFTSPRLKFTGPLAKTGMPVGQMVLLYSRRAEAIRLFGDVFQSIGTVLVPWS